MKLSTIKSMKNSSAMRAAGRCLRPLCVLCALFVPFVLLAQNQTTVGASSEDLQTIEDLYLSSNVEVILLQSQARSLSRETKFAALDTIDLLRREGRLAGSEETVLATLELLATEGTNRRSVVGSQRTNNFPEVRRRAVYLLGEIAGERAEEILYTVMDSEDETMVIAESILSLARVGVQSTNAASIRLTNLLRQNTFAPIPDSNIAIASIEAINALRIIDSALLIELTNVVNGRYLDPIRDRALEVIYAIRLGQN